MVKKPKTGDNYLRKNQDNTQKDVPKQTHQLSLLNVLTFSTRNRKNVIEERVSSLSLALPTFIFGQFLILVLVYV